MEQELFKRNLYEKRLRLTAEDLENQQRYDSEKRKLLNRALYGSGVVYGMQVSPAPEFDGVIIAPGFALDEQGRELFIPAERRIPLALGEASGFAFANPWYVCIYYKERKCGEGLVLNEDGTHKSVFNRIEEDVGVAFRQNRKEGLCLARFTLKPEQDKKSFRIASFKRLQSSLALGSGQARQEAAFGTLDVYCGESACAGESFYSGEISHGLGAGDVHITVAADGIMEGRRCQVSGELKLFQSGFACAVALFPDSGTFVVKICLHEQAPPCGYIKLHWYALKCGEANRLAGMAAEQGGAASIVGLDAPRPPGSSKAAGLLDFTEAHTAPWIEPGVAMLDYGESVQFHVRELTERQQKNLRFFAEGGEMARDGRFIAPTQAALIRIWAQWGEEANCRCSAIAIVRERR